MSSTLRTLALVTIALALVLLQSRGFGQSAKELSWSQVHLAGMHLSLVSPKEPGESYDLRFSEKYLAMDICSRGYCTGPLTVWKIEGNRLKVGNSTDAGDALVSVSDSMLVMRDKDGKLYRYAIVRP